MDYINNSPFELEAVMNRYRELHRIGNPGAAYKLRGKLTSGDPITTEDMGIREAAVKVEGEDGDVVTITAPPRYGPKASKKAWAQFVNAAGVPTEVTAHMGREEIIEMAIEMGLVEAEEKEGEE